MRRGPIAPARHARDHQDRAWFELVQSAGPADVDRLLDAPWPTSIDDATVRVHALADLPADPRIARAVVAAAARFRLPRARAFHDAVATLLARYPRATALAAIEAIERGDPERGEYGRARFELERHPPRSGMAAPTLVEAARTRTSDAVDVAALWAAHAASPGDL
ncbi:MAG: hypothetical protein NT062_38215, partial [Proteobacteria bacterium]|nr:hypothetical protein [Pseudomonadota bacterium]